MHEAHACVRLMSFAWLVSSCRLSSRHDGATSASAAPAEASDKEFRAFLREFEEGTNRFINGDATLWNQHVSHAEDATIMGGFGAYEVGGRAVRERYDWAVKRFRPSGGKMDTPT